VAVFVGQGHQLAATNELLPQAWPALAAWRIVGGLDLLEQLEIGTLEIG